VICEWLKLQDCQNRPQPRVFLPCEPLNTSIWPQHNHTSPTHHVHWLVVPQCFTCILFSNLFGIIRPRSQDTLQAQARSFYDEIPSEALRGHLATQRVTGHTLCRSRHGHGSQLKASRTNEFWSQSLPPNMIYFRRSPGFVLGPICPIHILLSSYIYVYIYIYTYSIHILSISGMGLLMGPHLPRRGEDKGILVSRQNSWYTCMCIYIYVYIYTSIMYIYTYMQYVLW